MENDLEKIIIDCAKNIKKRKELFYKIGQEYLKVLKDRQLEEKTFEVFQLIIKHEKEWKGDILIPEYYRLDKKKSIFKDIWYTLRDYFAWCVLYPNDVDNYFKHDKTGRVGVLENPKVRIMDKDNFKQVTKTENGKPIVVNVKKEKTFVIDSGFTLGQKDGILNVCVAGLLEATPQQKKKNEKPEKKQNTKEEETKVNTEEQSVEAKSDIKESKPKKVAKKKTVESLEDTSIKNNVEENTQKKKTTKAKSKEK